MVGGFWLQMIVSTILLYRISGYRPRWCLRRSFAGEMVRYGIGFGSATWIWHLRNLVNPLIVGRYVGVEAVGYVALAMRVVDMLSFVRNATWRISIAALAKIQQSRERLAQAITHGIWLQLLAVGPILIGFAWIAPWVLPTFFGERWLPTLKIYPFIALGGMVNAGFNMHASVLAVRGRNGRAAGIAGALVLLFASAASIFVGRFGLVGYGWAELAAMPAYVLYHVAICTEVGSVSYSRALLWWSAFGVGLFVQYLGWWAVLAPMSMLLLKDTWTSLAEIWTLVRKR
jgi:PST family polysaccharide transporter